jgi:bacillithiol system protein YtxJ
LNPKQITDAAELEKAISADSFLLVKHSRTCPISAQAWKEYNAFVATNPDVPTGWIDVQAGSDLARAVAKKTKVQHESPQALWIRKGKVGWHASHFDITEESLTRAAESLPKKATVKTA